MEASRSSNAQIQEDDRACLPFHVFYMPPNFLPSLYTSLLHLYELEASSMQHATEICMEKRNLIIQVRARTIAVSVSVSPLSSLSRLRRHEKED
jgi:hypothetical protein